MTIFLLYERKFLLDRERQEQASLSQLSEILWIKQPAETAFICNIIFLPIGAQKMVILNL